MTFINRYKNGETTKVYSDIAHLGQAAFTEKHYSDIEAVVTETMERAAYNLEVIYAELQHERYNFKREIRYTFESPLLKPLSNTDELLAQLEHAVAPIGLVPLSLKLFYKIVGSCNFAWDYETNEDIPWEYADPIQVAPLDAVVKEVITDYWLEEMRQNNETPGSAYLELSADYLHKDNISGGPAYALEITPNFTVDGQLLNEEHHTTFINYLRIVFENCGFGRIEDIESIPTFERFYDKLKPKLKRI